MEELLLREDLTAQKRRKLQRECDIAQRELGEMSVEARRCQVSLVDELSGALERGAGELSEAEEQKLNEDLQSATQELGELSVEAARWMVKQLVLLEERLANDQLSESERSQLEETLALYAAQLGDFSLVGANWKAQEVEELEAKYSSGGIHSDQLRALGLRLDKAKDRLGQMSALAAESKAVQLREVEEALAVILEACLGGESEEQRAEREQLEAQYEQAVQELGALSTEGAQWQAREVALIKTRIRRNMDDDRELRLEAELERSQRQLGELSAEGSKWLQGEVENMGEQLDILKREEEELEELVDLNQRLQSSSALLEELTVYACQWRVQDGESRVAEDDAAVLTEVDKDEIKRMVWDQTKILGETSIRVSQHLSEQVAGLELQLMSGAEAHEEERLSAQLKEAKRKLGEFSCLATNWKIAELRDPASAPQDEEAMHAASMELADYGVEATFWRARDCDELSTVLTIRELSVFKRRKLEDELERARQQLALFVFEAVRCQVNARLLPYYFPSRTLSAHFDCFVA